MKTSQLKELIKESVREAIKEELKEILLEAIKSPRHPVVNETMQQSRPALDPVQVRNSYMSVLGDMAAGKDTINVNTNTLQMSGPMDTTSEGSSLPGGEVSLDMIMNLSGKK